MSQIIIGNNFHQPPEAKLFHQIHKELLM